MRVTENTYVILKDARMFLLVLLGFYAADCTAQVRTYKNSINKEKPTTVKVLSFNIPHGATTKGDFDLDAIAKVISDADPDFVALQEVDYKTKRAKGYDLTTELGLRTKMTSIFGRTFYYDGGEFGEALLSKHTFVSSRTIPLPYQIGAPHIILEVTTVLPSKDTIAFGGTHLDYKTSDVDRVMQAEKINEVIQSAKYPIILAGDFNDVPNSKAINIIEEVMGHSYDKDNPEFTWPSDRPKVKIDYVFFYPKKEKWKVIRTEVIQDSISSDHCAFLSTLQLIN